MNQTQGATGFNPINLLLVEANLQVRQALEMRLTVDSRIRVIASVDNLPEAQAVIEQTPPDVILIEPKRLTQGTVGTLERLLASDSPPLVILLTSYHEEHEQILAENLGISCYLMKDINSEALVEMIFSCRNLP